MQPSMGSSCSSSPPWGPVHIPSPSPTRNCSSNPSNNAHCSSRGSIDRLQLAAVAKESLDRSGSVTRSLQCNRSGSVRRRLARVQLEPNASHPRTYGTRETRIARPLTTHHNRELPDIFLALASTTVFSVMDDPKNVMQLRLRPAQDKKPIFCHDFLS